MNFLLKISVIIFFIATVAIDYCYSIEGALTSITNMAESNACWTGKVFDKKEDGYSTVLVYYTLEHAGSEQIITAIWPSGKIIWSKNKYKGGPPYYEGQVKTNSIDVFFKNITNYYEDQSLIEPELVHEARTITISISNGHIIFGMESSHMFPSGTSHNREYYSYSWFELYKIIKAMIKFRKYKRCWLEIMNKIDALIPAEGKEIEYRNYKVEIVRIQARQIVPR